MSLRLWEFWPPYFDRVEAVWETWETQAIAYPGVIVEETQPFIESPED